ncbi:MAG: sigma-70 family RNA polymerase sigma factor [Myxococcota bacterium]
MSDVSGVMEVPTAERAVPRAEARVDALYRRHHELVYRLALRYGRGDSAWAEDVTQEVFLGLFDVIHRLDEREGLEPWFYRVTINRCLNRLRRERVRNAAPVRWLLGRSEKQPVDPERLTAARQGLTQAWSVLDELPPKERVAFCMYYLDGKRQSEIGEILGHGKSYVCKLIKRAEDRVRELGWEVGGHA